MKSDFRYIGKITIKNLRDAILDLEISEDDIIALNTYDFDKIVEEYRETYKVSITIPYFLLGVLITEDLKPEKIPCGRIKIITEEHPEYEYYYVEKED
ncbi:MAG: hypothetical protein JST62_07055 [Bacteroidetes bacterium]|nr:hypothetical protein [Bacteroidota bacterium]